MGARLDRERQIPAPVVQRPGELAPPPQAEATHQSFSSASSPQRRASPSTSPSSSSPSSSSDSPEASSASRLVGPPWSKLLSQKNTHSSKKTRRTCVEADTLPPTSALATAIMRTESRAASLPATSANSAEFFEASAKNTRFLDQNFGDQTGVFPINRSHVVYVHVYGHTYTCTRTCEINER